MEVTALTKTRRLNLALYNIDLAYLISERKKHISDSELCLMYALDDGEPHSQKGISEQWLIPKQTINTITKRWESEGLLVQTPIPGKRREMQITLTDSGKKYAKDFLSFVYEAEETALQKTTERYSDSFIDAIEYFGQSLKDAFRKDETDSEKTQNHDIV